MGLLPFLSTILLLSLASQVQAASITPSASSCVGHDNKGQMLVYVSCLERGTDGANMFRFTFTEKFDIVSL
jgi:hypothetical protein